MRNGRWGSRLARASAPPRVSAAGVRHLPARVLVGGAGNDRDRYAVPTVPVDVRPLAAQGEGAVGVGIAAPEDVPPPSGVLGHEPHMARPPAARETPAGPARPDDVRRLRGAWPLALSAPRKAAARPASTPRAYTGRRQRAAAIRLSCVPRQSPFLPGRRGTRLPAGLRDALAATCPAPIHAGPHLVTT